MLVMLSEQILFGVLYLIGAAVLLSALLRRFLTARQQLPGAIASFCIAFCSRSVPMDIWALAELQLFELPRRLRAKNAVFRLSARFGLLFWRIIFPLTRDILF